MPHQATAAGEGPLRPGTCPPIQHGSGRCRSLAGEQSTRPPVTSAAPSTEGQRDDSCSTAREAATRYPAVARIARLSLVRVTSSTRPTMMTAEATMVGGSGSVDEYALDRLRYRRGRGELLEVRARSGPRRSSPAPAAGMRTPIAVISDEPRAFLSFDAASVPCGRPPIMQTTIAASSGRHPAAAVEAAHPGAIPMREATTGQRAVSAGPSRPRRRMQRPLI